MAGRDSRRAAEAVYKTALDAELQRPPKRGFFASLFACFGGPQEPVELRVNPLSFEEEAQAELMLRQISDLVALESFDRRCELREVARFQERVASLNRSKR